MAMTARARAEIAFLPRLGSELWQARPCASSRAMAVPLWALTMRSSVGSVAIDQSTREPSI